jgi:hypothetical protein
MMNLTFVVMVRGRHTGCMCHLDAKNIVSGMTHGTGFDECCKEGLKTI